MRGRKSNIGRAAKGNTPLPPAWIDEDARAEWSRVLPLIGAVVHGVDLAALTAYCSTYSLWSQLRSRLTADNITNDDGKLNPQARYAESLLKQLRGLLDQLGFTPAARRQMLAGDQPTLDDVLGGGE